MMEKGSLKCVCEREKERERERENDCLADKIDERFNATVFFQNGGLGGGEKLT